MLNHLTENVNIINVDTQPQDFTLKILFGPLFGCEFTLPADDYFILINSGLADVNGEQELLSTQDHSAAYAQKTLFIPCDTHSPNIALHLGEKINNEDHTGYHIEILTSQSGYSTWIEENTLFRHEHICFAFKKSNMAWHEDISGFPLALPELLPTSPAPIDKPYMQRKGLLSLSISLTLIFAIAVISWFWFTQYQDENRVAALDLSLSGSPAALDIVSAKNKKIYIFGNGYREIKWLQEVLSKRNDSVPIIPIWTTEIIRKTTTILRNDGYPIVNLDLKDPTLPQLFVSESLNNDQKQQLKASTLRQLPFAERVEITNVKVSKILNQAQQGLDGLQIPYRSVKTNYGYALIIHDSLTDSALSSLRTFILNFYHRWGEQVISFNITLDDNLLRDKSYLGSHDGYIFLSPTHWYFPTHNGAT